MPSMPSGRRSWETAGQIQPPSRAYRRVPDCNGAADGDPFTRARVSGVAYLDSKQPNDRTLGIDCLFYLRLNVLIAPDREFPPARFPNPHRSATATPAAQDMPTIRLESAHLSRCDDQAANRLPTPRPARLEGVMRGSNSIIACLIERSSSMISSVEAVSPERDGRPKLTTERSANGKPVKSW